jgi:hypothetical protein
MRWLLMSVRLGIRARADRCCRPNAQLGSTAMRAGLRSARYAWLVSTARRALWSLDRRPVRQARTVLRARRARLSTSVRRGSSTMRRTERTRRRVLVALAGSTAAKTGCLSRADLVLEDTIARAVRIRRRLPMGIQEGSVHLGASAQQDRGPLRHRRLGSTAVVLPVEHHGRLRCGLLLHRRGKGQQSHRQRDWKHVPQWPLL